MFIIDSFLGQSRTLESQENHFWRILQIWQMPSSKYGSRLPANMVAAFQQIWLMPSSKYGWCFPANMGDAFQQIWLMPSSKYGICLPANMGYAFHQIWLMPSSKYGICLPAVLKSLAHYQLFCSPTYLPSIFLLEKTATTIFRFYHQFLFPDSL